MEISQQSEDQWLALLGQVFKPELLPFFPHKIFLIQRNGFYIDAFYPLPCHHLIQRSTLVGRNIRELFNHEIWKLIKKGFSWVDRHKKTKQLDLPPTSHPIIRLTQVTIIPFRQHYLVMVKDYGALGEPLLNFELHNPHVQQLAQRLWRKPLIIPDMTARFMHGSAIVSDRKP